MRELLAVLDASLARKNAPVSPRDFQVTRKTSVTVTYTDGEPRDAGCA